MEQPSAFASEDAKADAVMNALRLARNLQISKATRWRAEMVAAGYTAAQADEAIKEAATAMLRNANV